MISTRIQQFGASILMVFALGFTSEVLASQQEKTSSNQFRTANTNGSKLVSNKKEYSRNSVSSSLPDLRKYPSGTPRKKAFLRAVMPHITRQNAAITAERNWLISKQFEGRWSPAEQKRLKDIASRYKVNWGGNTRHIPWKTLLERVDIIPTSMVATMAAAESGWGTSKLARSNNNLFGMRCAKNQCNNAPGKVKGYLSYETLEESVSAYAINLNTHNAYKSFRKSRAQLRHADQEVTASNMIHKLKGYSTQGESYNNYLFAMYQDNRKLMTAAN